MNSFKTLNNLVGWAMFAVAAIVYLLTAEPTGSLWDCGEFISAAYKLEVVHPPGAPLFIMIGRMFTFVAELVSSNKANIAYSINAMSGICTAFLVLFIFWSTTILAKLTLVGYKEEVSEKGDMYAIIGAGVVAALATTFTSSVWFSAVEGEVYAMSSGFTGLVIWAALRWYINQTPTADRWLIFIAYMVGLSIGVHLLSLLAIPFVALLYYIKKGKATDLEFSQNMVYTVLGLVLLIAIQFMSIPVWMHIITGLMIPGLYGYAMYTANAVERKFWINMALYFVIGFGILVFVQYFFIPKIPAIAAGFDFVFVNSLGLGVGSGMTFFVILLGVSVVAGLYYAQIKKIYALQMGVLMFGMALMGFSTYASIIIRANANTPINMNNPSDPYSLLSYLNREQYGERPLFRGPHFASEQLGYEAKGQTYRPVKDPLGNYTYKVVGEKGDYSYNKNDYMFFPRLGHMDEARAAQYRNWLGLEASEKPTMTDNLDFFFRYQLGWMYFRYFMWNFTGRQNARQGFYEANPKEGNWISGVGFIDAMRLYPQSELPKDVLNDKGRNTYYFLPLILGLIGLIFQISKRPQEAMTVGVLFLITGIAITVFSNQPPNEPRERDYVLVGSFFTFCIWIGLSVPALYRVLGDYIKNKQMNAIIATGLLMIAPLIMGFQNWDDHSRAEHYGARDYATNFLQSCEKDAIVFTYGDNDTYPLWYAQEVEGIRPDVRVVNFSLLAVDWYIDQLRRKINESPAIEMTISREAYLGSDRNALRVMAGGKPMNLIDAVKFMGESHPQQNRIVSYIPTDDVIIPIDKAAVRANKAVYDNIADSLIVDQIRFKLGRGYLYKDEIALLDMVATNAANGWKRPIYFAVTVRPEKIMGFKDYLQMEGMALRIVPIHTPSNGSYAGAMTMGRVAVDTMFNNMTTKFRWGNFDKKELFIDESYAPSIQTLQFAFLRLASELKDMEDNKRAIATLDKLFEAFPHMNFPIDEGYSRMQALDMYIELGAEKNAQKHVMDLANTITDKMRFYSRFIAPNNFVNFANELRKFNGKLDEKERMLRAIAQQFEQARAEGREAPQAMYGQYSKVQEEYQTIKMEKEQFMNMCASPRNARVFEDEIMTAISHGGMIQNLMRKMQDAAFKKELEDKLTPFGFPPSQPTQPKIEAPALDSAPRKDS